MATSTRKISSVLRQEIAEAVLRIIGERGATALTVAVLAAEVGVTAGALYRHFASIDEILDAAAQLAVERIEETFPPTHWPAPRRLRELAENRIELMQSLPGLAWMLLSDQAYLTVPPSAIEGLRRQVARSKAYLLAALKEGIADGSLRSDLQADRLLVIFTGTVHALIRASSVHGSTPGPRSSHPKAVLDTLFTLLAPPPAGGPIPNDSSGGIP
jgi:AcrR family transcriptional regulator